MKVSNIIKLKAKDVEGASWNYAETWDKFPVPSRPSNEELLFLQADKKKIPHKSLLILGSTIEYRSICKRLGIHPFIADFDKSHYEILTKYSNEKFENEQFIEVDWLDIDDKNKYDVIVGHRAFNVIGRKMMAKFFKNMYNALKPGGVFYCKGNVMLAGDKDRLVEKIDLWASKKRKFPLFSYIEVDLYFHCADKDGYVDYPKARSVMKEMYGAGKFSDDDYELIKILISMSSEARFRGKIMDSEIKSAIEKAGFESEWIYLDKDVCSNMPIIKLTKP